MDKLTKNQIIKLLPHREPMLLIDELYDIKKLKSATATVIVKKDSFFVQGHLFRSSPILEKRVFFPQTKPILLRLQLLNKMENMP